jgi:hypothetical protein
MSWTRASWTAARRKRSSETRRVTAHPLAQARAPADPASQRRVADEVVSIEATLARVRRLANVEPPQALARSVELALHELRIVCARYPSRAVDLWRRDVTREMGALLFEHVADVEVEITIGPDLRLAQRDGWA